MPKKDTGYSVSKNLIKQVKETIQNYYEEHKKYPDKHILKKELGLSYYELLQVLKQLEKQKFLKIKQRGQKKNKNPVNQEALVVQKTEQFGSDVLCSKKNKSEYVNFYFLKFVLIFSGIGAIILSVFFTQKYMIEFLSFPLALLFSTVISVSNVGFLDAGIFYFFKLTEKNLIGLFFIPLFIAFCVSLFISMFSTIAGQFEESFTDSQENIIETTENIKQSNIWKVLEVQENELKEEREILIKNINRLVTVLNTYDAEMRKTEQAYYWSLKTELDRDQNRLKTVKQKLQESRNKKMEFIDSTNINLGVEQTVQKTSVYSWISNNVFSGVSADYIKFLLYMLSSIFVDVVAALGLAAGMFLKQKK